MWLEGEPEKRRAARTARPARVLPSAGDYFFVAVCLGMIAVIAIVLILLIIWLLSRFLLV
jgi:flagellar biogenesis protein FliO